MQLERDGAELQPGAVAAHVGELLELVGHEADVAGRRIVGRPDVDRWLQTVGVTSAASARLGGDAQAVRAIVFNKTPATNWSLGWHQDRTIAVKQRIDCDGFRHWNLKSGVQHVEPPFPIIEKMITARIHLDPVPAANAPLMIVPGSHSLGRLEEQDIGRLLHSASVVECLADRGDIWWYRTSIVHASSRAMGNSHRRVLQVDFSAELLPCPLEWRGIS